MADEKKNKLVKEEKKIPVFTVLKNGSIFKNIFLLDSPSSIFEQPKMIESSENSQNCCEEVLMVGRHPDCNIMLEHPSISRFHLRICSKPSSQNLSVKDLSSAHGTWVSGQKIEPQVPVELNEGDTLRLGASTRIYRLHWMPLSQAFDVGNRFVSPSDALRHEEEEEGQENQDENSTPVLEGMSPSAPPPLETLNFSFPEENSIRNPFVSASDTLRHEEEDEEEEQTYQDENSTPVIEGVSPSAPPPPETLNFLSPKENPIRNPFVSASDTLTHEEEGEEEEETYQDENSMPVIEGRSRSAPPPPKTLSFLFPEENSIRSPFVSASDTLTHEEEGEEEEETYQDENSTRVTEGMSPSAPPPPPQTLSFSSPEENSIRSPFVSAFDTLRDEEETYQDENSTPVIHGMCPSAPSPPETLSFSFPDENSTGNPFVFVSNKRPEEEGEEEEETYQNENSTTVAKGMSPSASPPPETMNSLFFGKNSMAFAHIQIPSAPPMPESMNSSSPDDGEGMEEEAVMSAVERLQEVENQSPQKRILDKRDISSLWSETVETESVNSSFPIDDVLSEITALQLDKENQSPKVLCSTEVLSERENQEMPFPKSFGAGISVPTEYVNSSLWADRVLSGITSLQPDKEKQSPQVLCSTEVLSERENQETPLRRSERRCNTTNLWSRRGKPASVLQIQTGKSIGKSVGTGISVQTETENQKGGKENPISRVLFPHLNGEEEIFTPDKENFSPNSRLLKSMKKVKVVENMPLKLCRSSSSKITADFGVNSRKKVKMDEITHSKLSRSSADPEEELFSSDKENQTPMILKERKPGGIVLQTRARLETGIMEKKRGLERAPFQSLLSNSISKSRSEVSVHNSTTRSSHSVNCAQAIQENINLSSIPSHKESKKKWNMVVDTTTLLNKESRKSLKLLQGLKGTQLIIPRMVIRELDSLNRRGSLFRRESDVSSVLKWIEECMVKTKWWIHVQSSVEESRPIAPTPPASPGLSDASNSGFAGGSTSSVPFSSFGSLTEIVSPTAEDHILECALLFKRIKIDERLILLSSDITLKIKAMAEGLLCETAEEFRVSIVNPYSERFLWAESTPRGPTWSCVDDIVLRENYYKCPIKKKSTPRGLKLILLHNSQYGKINSVN